MTDPEAVSPSTAAARYLEASVEPSALGPGRRLALLLGSVASASMGYVDSDGTLFDLVVTRRGTGEVVHRTEVGRREQADHMLAAIRADLDRLTLAQFADEWSVRLTPDR